MVHAGFAFTLACGLFSVFLIGWQGYNGASADWIYGFLAVFWSLLMMLRIMTLTEPMKAASTTPTLSQKILDTFRMRQEEDRKALLENSFGGTYIPFLFAGIIFAAWQVFCAANPAQAPALGNLSELTQRFFANRGDGLSFASLRAFDWGQGFLFFLSMAMMAFVFRSHSGEAKMTRPTLIVLSSYAVAGYILFAGLGGAGAAFAIMKADFTGSGSGSASYLLGSIPQGKTLSLFDIILLESGIAGLALLSFLLFIPLGYIALSAQNRHSDKMIVVCGMVTGSVLILSVFLSFTPALGGFLLLCLIALFLAWGHVENAGSLKTLDKNQNIGQYSFN